MAKYVITDGCILINSDLVVHASINGRRAGVDREFSVISCRRLAPSDPLAVGNLPAPVNGHGARPCQSRLMEYAR